jgi:phage tail-like protein
MIRVGLLAPSPLFALVLMWVAMSPMSAQAGRNPGFGPFTIKVEIEGVTQGVFQSVEGLSSRSEVAIADEYGFPAEVPGPIKGARLILRRPYDPLLSGLWRWRQSIIDGNPQKRDGHIFIFTAGGRLVAHWVFQKGWPCSWEVPMLAAGKPDAAEEVVEIVHTGLSLEELSGS